MNEDLLKRLERFREQKEVCWKLNQSELLNYPVSFADVRRIDPDIYEAAKVVVNSLRNSEDWERARSLLQMWELLKNLS